VGVTIQRGLVWNARWASYGVKVPSRERAAGGGRGVRRAQRGGRGVWFDR